MAMTQQALNHLLFFCKAWSLGARFQESRFTDSEALLSINAGNNEHLYCAGCIIEDFVADSVYCFCVMFWELGLCAACDFGFLSDHSGEFGFASHRKSNQTRTQCLGLVYFQSELGRHCSGALFWHLTLKVSAAEKVVVFLYTPSPCPEKERVLSVSVPRYVKHGTCST